MSERKLTNIKQQLTLISDLWSRKNVSGLIHKILLKSKSGCVFINTALTLWVITCFSPFFMVGPLPWADLRLTDTCC